MNQHDSKKEYQHVALWSAAALAASVTLALIYLLFENLKDGTWIPQTWARFVEQFPTLVFVVCGLVFWVVFAMLFYRRGSFVDQHISMQGWDTQSEPHQQHTPRPKPVQAKRGTLQPIELDLQYKSRICTGDLFLGPQTISFICYYDQNATQAHAKKAVASQFGPVGMLVYSYLTNSSGPKRKQRIEKARSQLQGLSLQAQMEQNPYSFVHRIEEIIKINRSSWTSSHLQVGDTKYKIMQIESDDWQIIENWCIQHTIDTEGF